MRIARCSGRLEDCEEAGEEGMMERDGGKGSKARGASGCPFGPILDAWFSHSAAWRSLTYLAVVDQLELGGSSRG